MTQIFFLVSYLRVGHDLAEPLSRCERHSSASEGVHFLGGISPYLPRNPQKFPNPNFAWLNRLTGPIF